MSTTAIAAITSPAEYITNTDETDALALNMAAELSAGESVVSAECELRRLDDNSDASDDGFPTTATTDANIVTQAYDARPLSAGRYNWIWNVTLNTGAVRSYKTILRVLSHD